MDLAGAGIDIFSVFAGEVDIGLLAGGWGRLAIVRLRATPNFSQP
jgi:hypothetical protein